MNIEQVREYTLSLFGVTEDQPFGDDIITFRLEGKIFVCLWLGGGKYDMNVFVKPNDQSQTCLDFGMARKGRTQFKDGEPRLALKLSPERNEEIRAQFPAVTPAYHWNKNNKIGYIIHATTRKIVDYCLENKITNVVIGDIQGIREGNDKGSLFNQITFITIFTVL